MRVTAATMTLALLLATGGLLLYAHRLGDAPIYLSPDEVIKDFLTGRTGGVAMTEDPVTAQESLVALPALDSEVFIALVRAFQNRGDDIDGMIRGVLSPEWPWDRLEMTLKAILRAAVAEVLTRTEVPAKVVLSEFIDIAHAFYAGPEPRMVNAVIDRIARALGRLDAR